MGEAALLEAHGVGGTGDIVVRRMRWRGSLGRAKDGSSLRRRGVQPGAGFIDVDEAQSLDWGAGDLQVLGGAPWDCSRVLVGQGPRNFCSFETHRTNRAVGLGDVQDLDIMSTGMGLQQVPVDFFGGGGRGQAGRQAQIAFCAALFSRVMRAELPPEAVNGFGQPFVAIRRGAKAAAVDGQRNLWRRTVGHPESKAPAGTAAFDHAH